MFSKGVGGFKVVFSSMQGNAVSWMIAACLVLRDSAELIIRLAIKEENEMRLKIYRRWKAFE